MGDHAAPFSSFLFWPPLIQNNGTVETMDQALLSLWQCHLKGWWFYERLSLREPRSQPDPTPTVPHWYYCVYGVTVTSCGQSGWSKCLLYNEEDLMVCFILFYFCLHCSMSLHWFLLHTIHKERGNRVPTGPPELCCAAGSELGRGHSRDREDYICFYAPSI